MNTKRLIIGVGVLVLVSLGFFYTFYEVDEVVTDSNIATDTTDVEEQRNKNIPNDEIYVYESEVDGPDECTEFEDFNPENSTCFYECADDQECTEIEDEINGVLDSWAQDYEGYKNPNSEDASNDAKVTATYNIKKGEIISLRSGKDGEVNKVIWSEIAALSPNKLSDKYLETFEVVSDPKSDSIAYVSDDDGNGKWNIAVNESVRKNLSAQEQKITLIHELGHIITLNKLQVIPGTGCKGLELSEGCATPLSYVQKFVNLFWKGKKLPYSEKNYVTEYAASEDVEDLAESWALFVIDKINSKPQTIAEKKVAFFNQFPELMKIREEMRSVLSRDIVRARKLKKA